MSDYMYKKGFKDETRNCVKIGETAEEREARLAGRGNDTEL